MANFIVSYQDFPVKATFTISPSSVLANEGDTITFTITASNFGGVTGNGTLYWSIGGTVNASDFSDTLGIRGAKVITNGTPATIAKTLSLDLQTEGPETMYLELRIYSVTGTIVATSPVVSVKDTSTAGAFALIVAGGGGGGAGVGTSTATLVGGGGGGAGGLLYYGNASFTQNVTYYIAVGTKGAAGASTSGTFNPGASGTNSSIIGSVTTITAIGGGGGGGYNPTATGGGQNGILGGSGGGGSSPINSNGAFVSATTGGAGTAGPPIQGYAGGATGSTRSNAGGGGGATSIGGSGIQSPYGAGGAGYTVPIPPAMNGINRTYYGVFTGSQYITVPTLNKSSLDFGAKDFTIEAWIYPTVTITVGGTYGILNNWPAGGQFIFHLKAVGATVGTSSLYLEFMYTNAATGISTITHTGSSQKVTLNAWNHIAVVRNGTTIKFYVNGNADNTVGNIGTGTLYYYNGTSQNLIIGTEYNGSGVIAYYFKGNISNLRIVNGSALYTSNFTPTGPLTSESQNANPTQVALLTLNLPTLVDASALVNTLTVGSGFTIVPYVVLPYAGQSFAGGGAGWASTAITASVGGGGLPGDTPDALSNTGSGGAGGGEGKAAGAGADGIVKISYIYDTQIYNGGTVEGVGTGLVTHTFTQSSFFSNYTNPTFAITTANVSVDQGSTSGLVVYNIATTNYTEGYLAWSTSGVDASAFTDLKTSGLILVKNDTATITRYTQFNARVTDGSSQTLSMSLVTPDYQTTLATSTTVTVNDLYTIIPNVTTVNELGVPNSVTFTITTKGISDPVLFATKQSRAAPYASPAGAKKIILGAVGIPYPTIGMVVTGTGIPPFTYVVTTSTDGFEIFISNALTETQVGDYNFYNGNKFVWSIKSITTGIAIGDFSDDLGLSGTVTIFSNTAAFTKTIRADYITEGTEQFAAELKSYGLNPVITYATSPTIIINDTTLTPPVVTTITPSQGPIVGGIITPVGGNSTEYNATGRVTITGSGFYDITDVTFNGISATYTVVSTTSITAIPPTQSLSALTAVNVYVVRGVSSSSRNGSQPTYTYVPAPTLISITPSIAGLDPNPSATIVGTNLIQSAFIGFVFTTSTQILTSTPTYTSTTQFTTIPPTITTPSYAGITYYSYGGVSNHLDFNYQAIAPTVTSISISGGPQAGGTINFTSGVIDPVGRITIIGTRFTGATSVTFNDVPATFTYVSATSITAIPPSQSSGGVVSINVTTFQGTSANNTLYTYYATPVLSSLSVTVSRPTVQQPLIISGTNLGNLIGIRVGGTGVLYATGTPTSTSIGTTAPAFSAGNYTFTVITYGGTSNGLIYKSIPLPTFLVQPNIRSYPTSGGTAITFTLSLPYQDYVSSVSFGGVAQPTFTLVTGSGGTSGVVTCTVPNLTSIGQGFFDLVVTDIIGGVGGSCSTQFVTIKDSITINSLSSTSGGISGGDQIFINTPDLWILNGSVGTSLLLTSIPFSSGTVTSGTAGQVWFGNRAGTNFAATSTGVSVTVPWGIAPETVSVTVVTATAWGAKISNGLSYTYGNYVKAKVLIAAGGGGGSQGSATIGGGGGGGGDYAFGVDAQLVLSNTYAITVGAGGAGTNTNDSTASSGNQSLVTGSGVSITAAGGLGGAIGYGGRSGHGAAGGAPTDIYGGGGGGWSGPGGVGQAFGRQGGAGGLAAAASISGSATTTSIGAGGGGGVLGGGSNGGIIYGGAGAGAGNVGGAGSANQAGGGGGGGGYPAGTFITGNAEYGLLFYPQTGTIKAIAPGGSPLLDTLTGVGVNASLIYDDGKYLQYSSASKNLVGRSAFTAWNGSLDYTGSTVLNLGLNAVFNSHTQLVGVSGTMGRFNRITANPTTGLISMLNSMTITTPIPGAQIQYNPFSNYYKMDIRNSQPLSGAGTITGNFLGRRFYGSGNNVYIGIRYEGTSSTLGDIAWECNIGPLALDPQTSTDSRYTAAATTVTTSYEVNSLVYKAGTAIAGGPGGSGRIQIYYNAQSGVAPATGLITGANTVTTVPSATAGATTYYHSYNSSTTVNGAVSTVTVPAQR